jgi:hypothetical protein
VLSIIQIVAKVPNVPNWSLLIGAMVASLGLPIPMINRW